MSATAVNIPKAPSVPYFFSPIKEGKGANCTQSEAIQKAWENKNSYRDILHPVRPSPLNNPSFLRRVTNAIADFFRAAKNWIWNKLGYINSTQLAERTQKWAKVNDAIVTHDFAPNFRVLVTAAQKMEYPGLLDIIFRTEYQKVWTNNESLIEKKAAHKAKLSKLDERAAAAFRKEYLSQPKKVKIESSKDFHQEVLDRYVELMKAEKINNARYVRF